MKFIRAWLTKRRVRREVADFTRGYSATRKAFIEGEPVYHIEAGLYPRTGHFTGGLTLVPTKKGYVRGAALAIAEWELARAEQGDSTNG